MTVLRALIVLVAAAGSVAGGWWFAFESPHLRFRSLRVVGNERASEAQIRHLADLTPGRPLLSLDLDRAAEGVRRHPWVASVEARRVFPDTVVLKVEERRVAAVVLLDQLYLVDEAGAIFRRADAADVDHPVLTGIPPALADSDPALARRILADGLALLDAVDGRAGLARTDVSEVRFDPESGYTLVLRHGGEVLLGFQDGSAFSRLEALASRGLDFSRPLRIDLGTSSAAVVSPL